MSCTLFHHIILNNNHSQCKFILFPFIYIFICQNYWQNNVIINAKSNYHHHHHRNRTYTNWWTTIISLKLIIHVIRVRIGTFVYYYKIIAKIVKSINRISAVVDIYIEWNFITSIICNFNVNVVTHSIKYIANERKMLFSTNTVRVTGLIWNIQFKSGTRMSAIFFFSKI